MKYEITKKFRDPMKMRQFLDGFFKDKKVADRYFAEKGLFIKDNCYQITIPNLTVYKANGKAGK